MEKQKFFSWKSFTLIVGLFAALYGCLFLIDNSFLQYSTSIPLYKNDLTLSIPEISRVLDIPLLLLISFGMSFVICRVQSLMVEEKDGGKDTKILLLFLGIVELVIIILSFIFFNQGILLIFFVEIVILGIMLFLLLHFGLSSPSYSYYDDDAAAGLVVVYFIVSSLFITGTSLVAGIKKGIVVGLAFSLTSLVIIIILFVVVHLLYFGFKSNKKISFQKSS